MTHANNEMSLLVPEGSDSLTKKLARACKRCGVALEQVEGQTTLGDSEWRRIKDEETGHYVDREVVFFSKFDRWTLAGFPGLSGYDFVCRIEHTDAGNVVSGPEAIEGWKEAKPTCDHCNTNRRRNDTFVLRHSESGHVVRVGRNCLADFLRADPTQLVKYSEFCRMLSDDTEFGSACGRWAPETSMFLACAVAAIEANGFRKSGMERATKNTALFLANPCPINGNAAADWKAMQPKAHHLEKADQILEWLRTDCAASSSDYLSNLHVVSQLECVSSRHEGLLASAPVAWAKAKEIELERKQHGEAREALPESHHIGEIKEKIVFNATLIRIRDIESDWGGKTMYLFRTEDGSDVVWWCSGRRPLRAEQDWGNYVDVGDRVVVKGTVKLHDTYRGRAQTTILRAKVTFVAMAPVAA